MSLSPFFLPVQTASSAASFLLAQKGSGNFVLTLNIEMLAIVSNWQIQSMRQFAPAAYLPLQ